MQDAELIAEVGVSLGRIKDDEFLTILGIARQELDHGSASQRTVTELRTLLNSAVRDLSPITLNDLRSGWKPFDARGQKGWGTFAFVFFCSLLLFAAAYTSLVYDRAVSLYSTTIELQDTRAAEQAIRLFGLLRKNRQDVVESLTSGKKDFLYEAFNKALSDLEVMNLKFQTYGPIAAKVLYDADLTARLTDLFRWSRIETDANPTDSKVITQYLGNYAKGPPKDAGRPAEKSRVEVNYENLDVQSLLSIYIDDIRDFTSRINVSFDPLAPNDYSYYLYLLHEKISLLGSWVLPALYGMLGAVIFHMRRLLDPALPKLSWLRLIYRVILGGFAGIILIWFWTPTSRKLSDPAFATLSSFGLAFLFGFSTDVFFHTLDRLVTYLSEAVGGTKA